MTWRKPEHTCPSCGMWTRSGKEAMAENSREHPIYKTDFSRPLWQIVESIRHEISTARGHLSDIHFAFPGWGERTDNVEGLLTCGLVALHQIAKDMEKAELRDLGDVVRWHPRGIGLDMTPGCFVCGTTLRAEGANDYMNNIAAFVSSKEDGEKVVRFIGRGARLDWRDYEPNRVQVKVGACDEHKPELEKLAEQWYVGPETKSQVTALDLREPAAR